MSNLSQVNRPSPAAPSGRTAFGRFAPGNTCGRGNPHARRAAELRSTIFRAITDEDIAGIVRGLIDQAKAGDVTAAKLVLGYAVGAPRSFDEDAEESEKRGVGEFDSIIQAIPPEDLYGFLRQAKDNPDLIFDLSPYSDALRRLNALVAVPDP